MAKRALSIMPFYGGKAKMAEFISDRLDYSSTDTYVEMFGGAARTLLNKPRHKEEYYNDYSSGLCTIMEAMSSPDTAREFIHRVAEAEASQEEFDRAKALYDECETDQEETFRSLIKGVVIESKIYGHKTQAFVNKELDKFIEWAAYVSDDSVKPDCVDKIITVIQGTPDGDLWLRNWILAYQAKSEGTLERTNHLLNVPDIDLAVATYIVFTQSRDARGEVRSEERFRDSGQFRERALNLYHCAERMEGVQVSQLDAMAFFRRYTFIHDTAPGNPLPDDMQRSLLNTWINDSRVMMYADPSYIKVESEKELLKGIDWENEVSLAAAIDKKYEGKKMPKNLGDVYVRSFGYNEQEAFLRCIQHAKCKVLVSNYDLILYNKYLTPELGWRREEFHTTTGVGSKKDNRRVEVIWYNY